MRNSWVLVGIACLLVGIAACSDDTNPPTYDTGGGGDFAVTEAGVDMAADMGVDMAPDTSVDMATSDTSADVAADTTTTDTTTTDITTTDITTTDITTTDITTTDATTADATTADGPVADAAVPKATWVLYSSNSASTKYTLNQVNVDGTGQKLFPGTPANLDICDLKLTGNNRYEDVNQAKPVPVYWAGEDYIILPNGSRLYHWTDGTDWGLGLLATDGTFEAPVDKQARATASSNCNSSYFIAISKDGKLAAVVLEGTKVALVKLDGTKWSSTSSEVLDVTPTGTTNIKTIYDESLTIGAKHLLFVVDEISGDDALYAAPLDGTAKATKVTLPNVDGKAPVYLNRYMARDKAGDHIALVVGATSSKELVLIYKDSSTAPTVTAVAATVLDYFHPGYRFMGSSSFTSASASIEPAIGISPGGKYVAFATHPSGKKVFVSSTDGVTKWDLSNSFVQTGSASVVVDTFGGFHWTDDDNLLFWAGPSSISVGLYHFKASTKVLTNVIGSSKIAAPWDGGNLRLDGGWLEPGGKYLYVLAGTSSDAINIWQVDLSALTAKPVTTGLDVNSGAYIDTGFEPITGTNLVAFIAKSATNTNSPYFNDLYVFDQSTGATTSVKKLTSTPTTGTTSININNILPSPDGKTIGYTTGSGATEMLTVVPTAGGTPVVLNGSTGSYFEDAYWWTPDSASIVYGGGSTSSSALDLKIVPITGGTSTTLHATQSYSYVFGVFK